MPFQGLRKGPPATGHEIAQPRFPAVSDEEREMPVEKLARIVLEPGGERMDFAFSPDALRTIGRD